MSGRNPIDAALSATNPIDSALAAQPSSPGIKSPGFFKAPGADRRVVNSLEGAWSLTQRPARAVRAGLAGRNPIDALAHGVPSAQAAADDAAAYKALGVQTPLGRFAADVVEDPLSWLGVGLPGKLFKGRSLAGTALNAAEDHAFPAVVKGATKIAKPLNTTQIGQHITGTVSKAHDTFGVDSAAKRALALEHGHNWKEQYAGRWAERNRALSEQNELERRLNTELDSSLKGVRPQDQRQIFGALQAAYDAKSDAPLRALPRELRAAALRYRRVTDARAALQGDEAVRAFTTGRSKLPPSLQPFLPEAPRGLQKQSSFIEHYVASAPHNGEEELRQAMAALGGGTHDALSTHNPNLQARTGAPLTDPAAVLEAERRANRNTARSVSAFDAGNRLRAAGRGDSPTSQMFERTYADLGSAGNLAKTATDWDKAGIFISPSRHLGNVTSLGAIADPLATAATIGRTTLGAAKKLVRRGEKPAERFTRQAPAINAGAVVAEGGERGSPLWDMIGKAPVIGKPLHGAYQASSGALWGYENELANRIWQGKVKAGLSEPRAALETREELVDYGNRSPFAQKASAVVPFATWRTKAPLAVARLTAKNPGRVSAAQRVAPAMFGGTQQGPYGPSTTSLPFAEAVQPIEDPARYVRASLGPIGRGLGNLGWNALLRSTHGNDIKTIARDKDWFTYGSPTLNYTFQTAPLIGTALDLSGHGLFDAQNPRSTAQALFESQTGLRKAFPKKPKSRRDIIEEKLYQSGVPWWRLDPIYNAEMRRMR